MARPRARRQFRVLNSERLELGGSLTPVIAPLMLYPCEVPSGTKEAGEVWYDDDNNTIAFYNGTAIREVAANPAGQSSIPNYRPVIAAATTLTSEHNGALLVFDAAAGYTITLPSAQVGLWFDVTVDTTVTSVVARLACATGDFFLGTILQGQPTTFTQTARTANGTTHLAWEGNGTTTGGIIGDTMQVIAISASQWRIRGINSATGSTATPFKTS